MRRLAIVACLAVCVLGASSSDLMRQFEEFKIKFTRKYSSPQEEAKRFEIFVANMKEAERMSKLNPQARFGVTQFSDVSDEEFSGQYTGAAAHFRRAVRAQQGRVIPEDVSLRSSMNQTVDWRSRGVVTPIKNQEYCGGCWAFSTTGNIEGQWAIAGNGLHSLSEQELISCDDTCNGCHGGNYVEAFQWIVNARGGGITSESQYPFASAMGNVPSCDMSGKTSVAFISSFVDIAHSESAMAAWVSANGPLSIAVDAHSLKSYTGGVLTNCEANQVDHAILVVGYDLTATTPYWIIKNQWGTTWGEEGYLYLEYGSNQCLITTLPSSSVVGSNPPPVPPPGSPAPPPAPTNPANGSFTQYTCPDATCMDNCTGTSFATGQCLPMQGGSAMAACGTSNLHLNIYNSSDCSGSYVAQEIPLDSCSQGSNGEYIYDSCGSSSETLSRSNIRRR